MTSIKNPILTGFNPDPSICRVGDDFYIATSTFEWFPGIQIYHSKDLKNWKLIAQPINKISQLDMKGVPDSCGVWAPCLTYNDGMFYLVYTNVRSFDGVWKDSPNFLITTHDILSDWSDPIYLNSSGFDGSFFHDHGKIWYLSMIVDHRKGKFFGGIELHEYDQENNKLKEEGTFLTEGTKLGATEGPHIYKRNGYYYLILAEGGTEYGHAETVLRSKSVQGPYDIHPQNPLLTSRNKPEHYLQKAGHASMVSTKNGDWYIVFLVGRPLTPNGRCILGRETAIEEIEWTNDWPYLKSGSALPRKEVPSPNLEEFIFEKPSGFEDFNQKELPLGYQSLRIPAHENWMSLTDRPGFLRLKGKESLTSTHTQALVAKRLEHFRATISTSVDFDPIHFQHMAGLVIYYNTGHYHYLHITKSDEDRILSIISSDNFEQNEDPEKVVIPKKGEVILKAIVNREKLQFCYSTDNKVFEDIGKILDMSILSDDYVRDGSGRYRPAFTGTFVGMCCQDLKNNKRYADFDWLDYKEIKD